MHRDSSRAHRQEKSTACTGEKVLENGYWHQLSMANKGVLIILQSERTFILLSFADKMYSASMGNTMSKALAQEIKEKVQLLNLPR